MYPGDPDDDDEYVTSPATTNDDDDDDDIIIYNEEDVDMAIVESDVSSATGDDYGITIEYVAVPVTGHDDDMATGHDDDTVTGHDDDTVTGHDDDTVTGHDDDMVTGHDDDMATVYDVDDDDDDDDDDVTIVESVAAPATVHIEDMDTGHDDDDDDNDDLAIVECVYAPVTGHIDDMDTGHNDLPIVERVAAPATGQIDDMDTGHNDDDDDDLAIVESVGSPSIECVDSSSIECVDSSSIECVDSSSIECVDSSSIECIDSSIECVDSPSVECVDEMDIGHVDDIATGPNDDDDDDLAIVGYEPPSASTSRAIDELVTRYEELSFLKYNDDVLIVRLDDDSGLEGFDDLAKEYEDVPPIRYEDFPAVVLDVGSWSIRVGCATDPYPKAEIPTLVGCMTDNFSGDITFKPERYVGSYALTKPEPGVDVKSCMTHGMISDWDSFERIMDHIYFSCLSVSANYHPVLITEPTFNETQKREELTEMMFEKYCVPALCLSKNSALAACSGVGATGIVIDCGETHTSIIPLVDGSVVADAVKTLTMGGKYTTVVCGHWLAENNIKVVPHCMVLEKRNVGEKEEPIWTRNDIPGLTQSWEEYMMQLAIEDFKHSVLEVSPKPFNDSTTLADTRGSFYKFPNGYNQWFGNERFKICEIFFDPINGYSNKSIGHHFMECLSSFNSSTRQKLLRNVVLSGGNSLIKGFKERLIHDLNRRIPQTVGLTTFGEGSRRHAAWIGGTVISKSSSFPQMCLTRQEYDEKGKAYINVRCP